MSYVSDEDTKSILAVCCIDMITGNRSEQNWTAEREECRLLNKNTTFCKYCYTIVKRLDAVDNSDMIAYILFCTDFIYFYSFYMFNHILLRFLLFVQQLL